MLALPGALLTACGPGGEVDRFLEDVRREFEVYEAETSVYGGVAPPIDLETLISRMLYERNRQHLGDDSDETDGGDESSVDDLKVAFSRNIGEVSREASRENFKVRKCTPIQCRWWGCCNKARTRFLSFSLHSCPLFPRSPGHRHLLLRPKRRPPPLPQRPLLLLLRLCNPLDLNLFLLNLFLLNLAI